MWWMPLSIKDIKNLVHMNSLQLENTWHTCSTYFSQSYPIIPYQDYRNYMKLYIFPKHPIFKIPSKKPTVHRSMPILQVPPSTASSGSTVVIATSLGDPARGRCCKRAFRCCLRASSHAPSLLSEPPVILSGVTQILPNTWTTRGETKTLHGNGKWMKMD